MDPSSGDESRVLLPTVVICVCIGITTVVVALRVYTRAFLIQQFGADDWALLVAYVRTSATQPTTVPTTVRTIRYADTQTSQALSVTTAGIVLSNNANGQGRHMNTLSPETTMNYFRVRLAPGSRTWANR